MTLKSVVREISKREKNPEEDVKELNLPSKEETLQDTIKKLSKRIVGGTEVEVFKTLIRSRDVQSTVLVHKLNKRNQLFLQGKNVDDLIRDINENDGVINEPVLCYFDGSKYYAIDGSRRRMSAIKGEFDLPVEYFTNELPYGVIKSHINSTNTSKDFSDLEKLLTARDEYRDLLHEHVDNEEVKQTDLLVEVLTASGFATSAASVSRIKKIFEFIHEEYFEQALVNQISQDSIRKLSEYIAKFAKKGDSRFTREQLKPVFDELFAQLENDFGTEYTGAELLAAFKRKFSPKAVVSQPPVTNTLVENEDFTIKLVESANGWELKGNGKVPKSFKDDLQSLLDTHFTY